MSQGDETNEQFWKGKYWKSQLGTLGLREWLEIIGIVVLIAYATATFFQLREATEANRFAQRASIDLGSAAGELAAFDHGFLKIYARNNGTTVAREELIEIFPVTLHKGETRDVTFPEFKGWNRLKDLNPILGRPQYAGRSIPPGVTFPSYEPYAESVAVAVQNGDSSLAAYVRVSFVDRYGKYCQSFCLRYSFEVRDFLLSEPVPDLCHNPQPQFTERDAR